MLKSVGCFVSAAKVDGALRRDLQFGGIKEKSEAAARIWGGDSPGWSFEAKHIRLSLQQRFDQSDIMDTILEIMLNHWPQATAVVAAIVITWIAARLYTRFLQTEKTCTSHSDEIKALHEDDHQLRVDHSLLTRSVDEIRAFIAAGSAKGSAFFSGKHSPRRLNASGEQLMRDADGESFLQKHKDLLFARMDDRKPQTAFDVEAYAYEILLTYSRDSAFNGIKNFLYNYPDMAVVNDDGKTVMHAVTLENVCFVMSLRLRDMYLEAHPALLTPLVPA